MDDIRQNIMEVQQNIGAAAEKSGRNAADITLVAVTKTIGIDRIQAAVDLGLANLGENRVQELTEKQPQIRGDVHWHLIGHLQTNKVKAVIGKVGLIHSVDSYKLLKEIDGQSAAKGILSNVLVEINIAGEETKNGIAPGELPDFLTAAGGLANIAVKGLMTVAPYVENAEENRYYFAKMRNLFIDNPTKTVNNITMLLLSMGMTNDYTVAIEEGANIVRIGTGIFGARDYNRSVD